MPDVITLGETLVVFDSVQAGPLRYSSYFQSHTGGAETNVAVGVIRQGHSAGWISCVGEDEFGQMILRTMRGEGVDTSRVALSPSHPTGIFFRQARGNGEYRNFYYRKNSAATTMTPEMLDKEYIASGKYFHVSGITFAMGGSVAKTAERAMEIARENGVLVSFDPNLRLTMWSLDDAKKAYERIWPYADIVLPGFEEGEMLLGTSDPDEMAAALQKKGCGTVVVKTGKEGAIGYRGNERVVAPGFPVENVVDAFGAGDSFAAGILSGMLKNLPFEQTLRCANAIGALAVSAPGNIEAIPTWKEVCSFLEGKSSVDR